MGTPSKEQMTLNFKGDDVRLFDQLRASARRNRRPLTNEILYRLDRSFTADNKQQEV